MNWGYTLISDGYSGFLDYVQLAYHKRQIVFVFAGLSNVVRGIKLHKCASNTK